MDFRRMIGTATGVNGQKEMEEIADLEDECVVKMRQLNLENQQRTNKKLGDVQANYQSNRAERVDNELARSQIGPALLWQI